MKTDECNSYRHLYIGFMYLAFNSCVSMILWVFVLQCAVRQVLGVKELDLERSRQQKGKIELHHEKYGRVKDEFSPV